jgi:hypothetical protein
LEPLRRTFAAFHNLPALLLAAAGEQLHPRGARRSCLKGGTMTKVKRIYVLVSASALGLLALAGNALAAAAYPISGASAGFTDELNNALTTALPIGAGIVALFVGWKVFKRLSHG